MLVVDLDIRHPSIERAVSGERAPGVRRLPFIVVEGIDGAGTTTQTARQKARLERMGHRVHTTREPSDNPILFALKPVYKAKAATGIRGPLAQIEYDAYDGSFARGSTSRDLFERHFPGREVVMELGSIASVKGNVRTGIGVALIRSPHVDQRCGCRAEAL